MPSTIYITVVCLQWDVAYTLLPWNRLDIGNKATLRNKYLEEREYNGGEIKSWLLLVLQKVPSSLFFKGGFQQCVWLGNCDKLLTITLFSLGCEPAESETHNSVV